jgi:hypothetical protein
MKRALLYTVIAVALLYAIRAFEYAGIRRAPGGEFAKLRTLYEEENNFELVIIGSSRAECQFYNPIIDSVTGVHSYNLGLTGATLPFIATTFEAYLVHSKAPKYVVLNLDLHTLGDNTDTVYHFPRYFAFLGNEKLYEGLNARDGRFFFFKWLPFYSMPYFSDRYRSNVAYGWLNRPTKYDAGYAQGFAPTYTNPLRGDLDTMTIIETHADIPPAVWESVNRIRELCAANNCRLIFVVSPLYVRQEACVTNYSHSLTAFHDYAVANNIGWIDFGHDSIRYRPELYADPGHLNLPGAKEFTLHFSPELGQYLEK